MKVSAERQDLVWCDLCGNQDEGVRFTAKIFWILKFDIYVCEGCLSRLFRKFRRGR